MPEKDLKRLTVWGVIASMLVILCGWFNDLPDAGASRLAATTIELLQNRVYLGEWGRYNNQPVLLLWISAASFSIFGPDELGFRFPGLPETLFTLFSVYQLTRLTGNKQAALIAVLITATLQSTFLLNQNVSVETYSTAFYTFMVWQLVAYFRRKSVQHFALMLLGLLFMLLSRRTLDSAPPEFNPLFPVLTVLWAFAPWTLLLAVALYRKLKSRPASFLDRLTLFAFVLPLAFMSANPFQTTYDVFIILPVGAAITAGYLAETQLFADSQWSRKLYYIQITLSFLILGALFCLVWFPFAANNYYGLIHFMGLLGLLTWLVFFSHARAKLVISCVILAVGFNLVLNTYFFPNMMAYQAGSRLGKMAKENEVSRGRLLSYKAGVPFSLQFYSGVVPVEVSEFEKLVKMRNYLVYTDEKLLDKIRAARPDLKIIGQSEDFPVSKPTFRFLNPHTRQFAVTRKVLIRL